MSESAADRTAILDALQTALESVTTPKLNVVQGLPWSIQTDRSCFYWYTGDGDNELFGPHALSERAVTEKFMIGVYWPPPPAQQLLTAMVAEAWGACRSIQQAIEANVTLGGNGVAGLQFEPARAGFWQHFSGATFYALEVALDLWLPSADSEGY